MSAREKQHSETVDQTKAQLICAVRAAKDCTTTYAEAYVDSFIERICASPAPAPDESESITAIAIQIDGKPVYLPTWCAERVRKALEPAVFDMESAVELVSAIFLKNGWSQADIDAHLEKDIRDALKALFSLATCQMDAAVEAACGSFFGEDWLCDGDEGHNRRMNNQTRSEMRHAIDAALPHLMSAAKKEGAAGDDIQPDMEALRRDKERLDSGQIQLQSYDEFNGHHTVIHSGFDLRAAIDTALAAQAGKQGGGK